MVLDMLNKFKKVGTVIFVCALIPLAIIPIVPTTNEFINNLTTSLATSFSIVALAVTVIFNVFKKPNDIWLKVKTFLLNPTCYWSFEAVLSNNSTDFDGSIGEVIHRSLVQHYAIGQYEFKKLSEAKFRYSIDKMKYYVMVDQDGDIHISVDRIQVGYRDAVKLLEKDVTNVLEQMKSNLNITDENYFLTIEFNKKNPYLSREANLNQDISFTNVIIEYKIASSSVRITQKSLLIAEQSFETFKTITKEFLTFSI